jgi:chemotaxis response regulator CheB
MKIAIVNDMPMAVEALRRALAFEPAHQVVWVASNGAEAVQRCAEQTPDLILMDLIMPVMDGVEATRRIMAETPCAIVIVTVDRKQNVHRVFEAMGHGALDVVDTPALGAGDAREAAAPLLRKILNIGWLIGQQRPSAARRCAPLRRLPSAAAWWPSARRRAARRRWKSCSRAAEAFRRPSCWCSMSTRCSPPAWPNGSARRAACRCAWPAKANRRSRGRCCWPAPTTTFAC